MSNRRIGAFRGASEVINHPSLLMEPKPEQTKKIGPETRDVVKGGGRAGSSQIRKRRYETGRRGGDERWEKSTGEMVEGPGGKQTIG